MNLSYDDLADALIEIERICNTSRNAAHRIADIRNLAAYGKQYKAALAQQPQPEPCIDHDLRIKRLVEENLRLKAAQR